MLYRDLGNSGIKVSSVAFGAWAIGGWMWGGAEERDAINAIHASLDNGVNCIDTAPIYGYGRSEEIVGKAIGDRREKVVLATKCGMVWDREQGDFFFHANEKGITPGPSEKKVYKCLQPDSIRAEVDRSLGRLKTDYIDLYQTHWQDSTTPIADTMAVLEDLKKQGKIRAIGASNATVDQMKVYGRLDGDQEKFSMLDRDMETKGQLAYCLRKNIAVLAYSPLANGLLTGKITPKRKFNEGDLRRMNPRFGRQNLERIARMLTEMKPIADRHQATLTQLVIAWTIAQPGVTVALVGARNAVQAIENAQGGGIELEAEEVEEISEAIKKHAAA
jgi:methylglyoxal reductase